MTSSGWIAMQKARLDGKPCCTPSDELKMAFCIPTGKSVGAAPSACINVRAVSALGDSASYAARLIERSSCGVLKDQFHSDNSGSVRVSLIRGSGRGPTVYAYGDLWGEDLTCAFTAPSVTGPDRTQICLAVRHLVCDPPPPALA